MITKSEKEMIKYAKKFADTLVGGEMLALIGDLGSGKTTFTKGLADGLGVENTITSPTFVLMKAYTIRRRKVANANIKHNSLAISHLVHIDAYRLTSGQDLEDIGVTEYLKKKNTVTVIEWADRVQDIWPKDVIRIDFKVVGEDKREIKITKRITHNM
ncbi:MAG TPA: tRNA (adenosine(37)-N6)-threonylcarbamoyltransferase complex ATPase subunit type 1 TsaE [Patescibacteria group bacterium]|nr:tRNA (adenosine(37)-N6)-threonylcarbamoyltransferase complex ATPase subunit type 1 TsaE [Patescibacteria group bacterium]